MPGSRELASTDPVWEPITGSTWLVADQRLTDWAKQRLPRFEGGEDFGPHVSLGIFDGEAIIAVMVVHNYNPRYKNAEISMAASTPRWATRSSIRKLLDYPFRQLGVRRVTTMIAAGNVRAIKFNEGLGFKREGLARHGYGDDDAVILGLLVEETPAWMGYHE